MGTPETRQARLPRRRRSFVRLRDADVRALTAQVLGEAAIGARVLAPAQGVNNQTFFVEPHVGPPLVLKARPRSAQRVRNSAQWPRYTQELFGTTPDGDVSTFVEIAALLERYGSLRVPELLVVDQSLRLVPCDYVISERLTGDSFDWVEPRFTTHAARELGDHLGRLHRATRRDSFGVFADAVFPAETWWPRFSRSFRVIAAELTRISPAVRTITSKLEEALDRALATGAPDAAALVCIDQSPTHYLRNGDGGIGGLVDLEAHLWAPPEYELAVVELWVADTAVFRAAYERHHDWPHMFDELRPAYWLYTWMEWIYCLHTLLHDHDRAADLEIRLCDLAHTLSHWRS